MKIEKLEEEVGGEIRVFLKVPYEHTDDFGNTEPPFYRREPYFQEVIDNEITSLEKKLEELQARKNAVEK